VKAKSALSSVDGRTLTEEQKSLADLALAEELLGHTLVPGEIGCALSHIGVYEKMVTENIASCIILEDDINFDPQFKNIILYALNFSMETGTLLI
jgi:glycosyl transferase family 25